MMSHHTTMMGLVGDIATRFSNLEWQMSEILAKLIDTSTNSIVGSFLADDFTLGKTTDLVRKLARYRFVHDDVTVERITKLCDSIDEVRLQRNLFMHGMWNVDANVLAAGKISVLDMRWKEKKGAKSWSRGQQHVFSRQDLIILRDRIGQLFHVALKLSEDLQPNKMMPHWQQNKDAALPLA